MQAMTQGRDGTSWAHARALKLVAVARRLSLVAAVFAVAALLAGTAGTSYAQPPTLEDSVAVSNYGAAFNGSLESFCGGVFNWLPVPCPEGANHNAKPVLRAAGSSTLLGASTGAALDAVSSVDDHIAVAVPLDLVDQTCFGEPAVGVSYPEACRALLDLPPHTAPPPAPFAGTGFAAIFSPGANGNTAPENIIGTRNAAFSVSGPLVYNYLPPVTGVNTPQGVAFESPYDGNLLVPAGHEIVAVANTLPYVIGNEFGPQPDEPACAAFGGATVGSVTEYDRQTLIPGYNDDAVPFQSSIVLAANDFTIINHKKAGTTFTDTDLCLVPESSVNYTCIGFPYFQNVTIGGCNTFLLAPVGLTFDGNGYLFVVNNAVPAAPSFVDVFYPSTYGDSFPAAAIGLTAGGITSGVAVAVSTSGPPGEGDVMYVSDVGAPAVKGAKPVPAVPPSIDIFTPFTNCFTPAFPIGCVGTAVGKIQGNSTRLNRPQGVALSRDGDTLYVVNALGNSLEMFTGVADIAGTENLAPTLIIAGPRSQLNMPVGVALPQFTPTPKPDEAAPSEAARN